MSKPNMIKTYRLQKAWSQEQLSEFSGVSVRTIQRLEKGGQGALETLKAIAATLDVDIQKLQNMPNTEEANMNTSQASEPQDPEAIKLAQAKAEVQELKGFYSHLSTYVLVMLLLTAINLFFSPYYFWAIWPMLGWGIGIVNHALGVFNIWPKFGKDWEEKQIQKRLKK
ncbi:2TM domain-containing protein [Motilimonas sp. 1_MG-2023]|uniref:2TM domain-containing protein n=1 Tax=Motilimonas sp. 1_MG-2023 TaxID=3062672 RepID=UPI0026E3EF26|nr:2TM domain-containing protein [Motilimonas sp. 1_MG-2023]MDO6526376.1 2TM domain-containing protein [Motilimonas sp. 1_MG-2023]